MDEARIRDNYAQADALLRVARANIRNAARIYERLGADDEIGHCADACTAMDKVLSDRLRSTDQSAKP